MRTAEEAPAPGERTYVRNVHIGAEAAGDTMTQDGMTQDTTTQGVSTFDPGDAVTVSIELADAPPETPITVQWIGPQDQHLGYEIQTVSPDQERLSFTHDNTHDWEAGTYRAEIWVNDQKVSEQRFELGSSGAGV